MKALIAAGGSGTRLRPLTFSSNKQLLPVLNKPLLLYPFEAVLETGIKEIGLVVNETRPTVENLLGDGSKWGVKVTYINQDQPLGLAHVVKISKDYLEGQPFVYILGDNIFTQGITRPFNRFSQTNPDGLLTYIEHKENTRLGVPYFDENGKLEKVVEKPENPPNSFGVPGLYMFGPRVFDAFEGSDAVQPSKRGELEITDLYTYLLQHNYKVEAEKVEGLWLDPGKFNDMLAANEILLGLMAKAQDVDPSAKISDSTLEGRVKIGKNVSITNSFIGPNVTIGDDCVIEQATVKESVIFSKSTIKNVPKPIAKSLIGKNTTIAGGSETVTLFIGDNCNVSLV
jgi:glucose-1-phosphate thymidylyltransferase